MRILITFIWSLMLTPFTWSQKLATIPSQTIEQDRPLEKSLLWEISGNDLEQSSYLFGTIHIIDESDYFFPDIAAESLDACDQVAFEINMDDMSDMSAMFSLFQDAFMKDGVTLKDLLDEEEYSLVQEHMSGMGLPIMLLERIKPMFLSIFTSGDIEMGSLQSGDMMSYEMELHQMAKSAGKSVAGLETIEFQLSLFDSIPYEAQAQMLVEGIQQTADTTHSSMDDMFKSYKDQDIESMHQMIDEDDTGMAEYEHLLVKNRNLNWIPAMKEMMNEQPTFFAVGAGHLGGPYGVVRLLRKAGYQLKPLMHIEGLKRI